MYWWDVGKIVKYVNPRSGFTGRVGRVADITADSNYPEATVTVDLIGGAATEVTTFVSHLRKPTITEEVEALLFSKPRGKV